MAAPRLALALLLPLRRPAAARHGPTRGRCTSGRLPRSAGWRSGRLAAGDVLAPGAAAGRRGGVARRGRRSRRCRSSTTGAACRRCRASASTSPRPRLAAAIAARRAAGSALTVVAGARARLVAPTSTTSWTAATASPATMAVCGFARATAARRGDRRRAGAPRCSRWPRRRLPFLVVNAPPARMFMGDVGAVPLGFLAAAFGIAGWRRGHLAGVVPAARVPAVRRRRDGDARAARAGAASASGRRTAAHYYQRLHQLGAGHRGTLAVYGVLMAGTGGVGGRLRWRSRRRRAGWSLAAWCVAIARAVRRH